MTQRIQRLREPEANRYTFDFDVCHFLKGWAQCDTGQDAAWFGMWANPSQLRIVTFAEGDVIIETADSPEDFKGLVRRHKAWNDENGFRFAIDGMCQEDIVNRFTELGLADLLH